MTGNPALNCSQTDIYLRIKQPVWHDNIVDIISISVHICVIFVVYIQNSTLVHSSCLYTPLFLFPVLIFSFLSSGYPFLSFFLLPFSLIFSFYLIIPFPFFLSFFPTFLFLLFPFFLLVNSGKI